MFESLVSQDQLKKLLDTLLREQGVLCRKVLNIRGRPAREGEHVVTVTSSGLESTDTAHIGDFIVENQTTAHERYVVSGAKLQTKYKLAKKLDCGWAEYEPNQESLVVAVEVDETILQRFDQGNSFQIEAPWGSPQRVNRGDFLVAPADLCEIYCIGRKEFKESYAVAGRPT